MTDAISEMSGALQAETLALARGGRTILADVTLDLRPGCLTVIAGPNGAGKSTLLKALAGELAPAAGRINLDGVELGRWRPRALAGRRAVLAQAIPVAFPFTVHEVVALGRAAGPAAPGRPLRELVPQCLAAVDLADYGGRAFQHLSGGEQQRVQVARVLCQLGGPGRALDPDGRPLWLFLDEPTQSLDIGHQLAVLDVARAHARGGGGAVAILHDLNLASLYADRLIVLGDGRVLGDGPPAALLSDALLQPVFGPRVRVHAAAGGHWVLPVAHP